MFKDFADNKEKQPIKLEIVDIQPTGGPDKEYVEIEVRADCNLSNFAIVDNTFKPDGKASNKSRHFHWFPACPVKKGDTVYLYTGKEKYRREEIAGATVHTFYWGLRHSVWNDDGDAAVLFEMRQRFKKKTQA